jgi:23S rRNA pseudouridine955/2504/2580 synthase
MSSFEEMILYEDEDYIVVNKPPFLSSLKDRLEKVNLLQLARSYLPEAQLCHRLDKDTSGVVVIARNPESYRFMSIQFEKRRITKYYHAVVNGIHDLRDTRVEAPISTIHGSRARIDFKNGKRSLTLFRSLRAYQKHTLIRCQPITGRMHQIRVHLSYLQAPLVGDLQYGGSPFYLSDIKRNYRLGKFEDEKPLTHRLALHAHTIIIPLSNRKNLEVEAPYPKDFKILLKQLGKYT